jgi:hypothetical protein
MTVVRQIGNAALRERRGSGYCLIVTTVIAWACLVG